MSASPTTPTVRIVPGAPPPAPLSKSQKKKRKGGAKKSSDQPEEAAAVADAHAAALIDHAPSNNEVKEGSVAPELVVRTDSTAPGSSGGLGAEEPKSSPIVDMLNKRLKASQKKLVSSISFIDSSVRI